jgi:ornithine cyclodeaminase/alanine dehydrogenase
MTLMLAHSDITALLDRDEVRKAIEIAFAGLATGDCQNPAPRGLKLPAEGTAIPMTAATGDLVAVKLLCDLPGNRQSDRPVQRSTIMLTSALTGECVAILDGRAITVIRTAAASAVATDHIAPPSARVLGLIGAGDLAIEHAYAIASVRDIDAIVVWSRNDETVQAFRSATENLNVTVKQAESPAAVIAVADVVCTLTPSRNPIVSGAWLRAGQHVNAVGAPPRPDHREIDSTGMRRAHVVVDSRPTAMTKSGEILLAIAEGVITADDVRTELGSVVAGLAAGRTTEDQITLFDSVGIGLQDLVTAELVVSRARELRV